MEKERDVIKFLKDQINNKEKLLVLEKVKDYADAKQILDNDERARLEDLKKDQQRKAKIMEVVESQPRKLPEIPMDSREISFNKSLFDQIEKMKKSEIDDDSYLKTRLI